MAGCGGGVAAAACGARRVVDDAASSSFAAALPAAAAAVAGGAIAGGVALAEAAPPAGQAAPPAPGSAVDAATGKPLPHYTRADVAAHNRRDTRIWVTYQARPASRRLASHCGRPAPRRAAQPSARVACAAPLADAKRRCDRQEGVYDVTDFVAGHPGGAEKLLMAAGGSADAFWRLYPQHYRSAAALAALAQRRIGTLDPKVRTPDLLRVCFLLLFLLSGSLFVADAVIFRLTRMRRRLPLRCLPTTRTRATRRCRPRCGCTRARRPRRSLRWRC